MDSHYISKSRSDTILLINRLSIQRERVKKTARVNHEAVNVVVELSPLSLFELASVVPEF